MKVPANCEPILNIGIKFEFGKSCRAISGNVDEQRATSTATATANELELQTTSNNNNNSEDPHLSTDEKNNVPEMTFESNEFKDTVKHKYKTQCNDDHNDDVERQYAQHINDDHLNSGTENHNGHNQTEAIKYFLTDEFSCKSI